MNTVVTGKRVALLQGGPGSEREISLRSAMSVRDALKACGAEVADVDVEKRDFRLPPDTFLAFNVIHGTFGEDGEIQEILDQRGVPYTGARAASSRLAFDKIESKKAFAAAGVPTPEFQVLRADDDPAVITLPVPFVLKPPREGSSVGVHIIRDAADVPAALDDLQQYGDDVLAEAFISGLELTVSILGDDALPVIHIRPRSGFYDIHNKYPWLGGGGGTDYICPADISRPETAAVQKAALDAHRALGVEVYSRVDVLFDAHHKPFVLEVNTIPGMTESSLLPKAAVAAGIEFPDLCARIAELSLNLRIS